MNQNVAESISAFESSADDLGIYYEPDEVTPECRRHHLEMVYYRGFWRCPRCRINIYDSVER